MNEYQRNMKVQHAKRRLVACQQREDKAGRLYAQRKRETQQAEEQYRHERRRQADENEARVIAAAISACYCGEAGQTTKGGE